MTDHAEALAMALAERDEFSRQLNNSIARTRDEIATRDRLAAELAAAAKALEEARFWMMPLGHGNEGGELEAAHRLVKDTLAAYRSRPAAEVVMKPLVWEQETATEHVPETWRAKSIGREYDIQRTNDGKFDLWADVGNALAVEETLEAAKAAAQADYEERIRSALATTERQS